MVAYNKFEIFSEDIGEAVHDLDATGDSLNVYLSNATPSASLDAVKADLAEITAGNGYTANGEDVTNTYTRSGLTSTLGATDVSWTASGGSINTFQYVALMNLTTAAKVDPLICWWDNGSAVNLANGESFTVDFQTDQIFTLA